MDIQADREGGTLTLTFADSAESEDFLRRALDRRSFLVKVDFEPRIGSEWAVDCGGAVELQARVAQLYDTVGALVGVSLEIDPWSGAVEAALREALGEGTEEVEGNAEEAPEEEDSEGENRGASPMHRIKSMNPNQRARLAYQAGRVERQILLRDGSAQVLQNLLGNPRIEAKEILAIVKSTHATAPILKRVAEDPRWGKNLEILAAVTRNPKTPSLLAIKLVEKVRTGDLRLMAKMSGGLRESVRRAALREYLRRTSREPR